MGKSKYQAKVAKKIMEEPRLGTSGPKYIDDEINPIKKSGSNQGAAVFLILTVVVVLGISGGLIYNQMNANDNTTTTTTLTIPSVTTSTSTTTTTTSSTGLVVQDGKFFTVHYILWKDANGDGYPEEQVPQSEPDAEGFSKFDIKDMSETGLNSGLLIPGFYNNILGMTEGQEKEFTIPAGQGYTSGDLANIALRFRVRITNIRNTA